MESGEDECTNTAVPIAISSLSLTQTKDSSSKDDQNDSQSTYEFSGQPLHEETLATSNTSSLNCTDKLNLTYEFSNHGQKDAYPVSKAINLCEPSKTQEKLFPDYSVNCKSKPKRTSKQLVSQEIVKLHQQTSNQKATSPQESTYQLTPLMTHSLPLSNHDSQLDNRCLDALTRLKVRSLLNSMTSFIATEFQTSGNESSVKSKSNSNLQFPNTVISPFCSEPDPTVIPSTSSRFCIVKTSDKETLNVPITHSNTTSGERLLYQQTVTNNIKSTVEPNKALPRSSNCLHITDSTERIHTRKQKTQSKLDDCISSMYQNVTVKQERMTESSSGNSFHSQTSLNVRSNEIKILEKIFPVPSFSNSESANTAVSTTIQVGDRYFKVTASKQKQETKVKTTSFSLEPVSTTITSPLFSKPKLQKSSGTTSIPTLSTPILSIPNFRLLIPSTYHKSTEPEAHHQSVLQQLLGSVVTKERLSKQPSIKETQLTSPVGATHQVCLNLNN